MKIRGGWIVDTVNGYASKSLLPNLSFVTTNYILIVTFPHNCYENYLHAALFHLLLLNLFLTYFYTSYFLYVFSTILYPFSIFFSLYVVSLVSQIFSFIRFLRCYLSSLFQASCEAITSRLSFYRTIRLLIELYTVTCIINK